MIQSKLSVITDVKYQKGGHIYIEYVGRSILPNEETIYHTVDWFITYEDGVMTKNFLRETYKTYSLAKINFLSGVIENMFGEQLALITDLVEKERKKIQIGLYLDVTTDLLDDGITIYGLTPDDWEMIEI